MRMRHRRLETEGDMQSEEAMQEQQETEVKPVDLSPGLRAIRRRRWCLWGVIIIYVPLIKIVLSYWGAFEVVSKVFAVWFVFMFAAVLWSSLSKCPRCGNYFHIQGLTLLYLRKCLHCQLHINADRNGGA